MRVKACQLPDSHSNPPLTGNSTNTLFSEHSFFDQILSHTPCDILLVSHSLFLQKQTLLQVRALLLALLCLFRRSQQSVHLAMYSSTFSSTHCIQPVESRTQMPPSQGPHSYSCIPTSSIAEGVSQVNAAGCKRHSRTRLENEEALLPEPSPRAVADPHVAAQKQTWDTRGTTGHSREEQNTEWPGAPRDMPPASISRNAVPYPLTKNTKALCSSPPSQTSSNLCCWVMHQHRDEILMPGQELVCNSHFKITASLMVIEKQLKL